MKSRRASSGISKTIKATMYQLNNNRPIVETTKAKEFTIKIANTLEERQAVFQLGYQTYLEKGFIKENAQEMMIQPYDFCPETVILIVQDKDKNIAGTVTLVFNDTMCLPAEKIYSAEITSLKVKGEKLVELSRLIISANYRNSKEILLLLFNYLAVYAFRVKKCSNMIVEVNPHHKNFYKALLSFKEIGNEKACPSVENAPAVLLHLPLNHFQLEVQRCKNIREESKKERSLYAYFLKPEQEGLVIYYLKRQANAMSAEEKLYFGYSESRFQKSIAGV